MNQNTETHFKHIRIVLVETSHPGNIGSCARAMKTMGLSSLYLVKPKFFPHPTAQALAAGADTLLEEAVVTETLSEALADCSCIFVTSNRARRLALPGETPASAAMRVVNHYKGSKVAIVFGRERTGLTNVELLQGHYHICIPTHPGYNSLNLAQSVQIIAYELYQRALNSEVRVAQHQDRLAEHAAMEQFYVHLAQVLQEIGFLREKAPRRLMERMRRLFGRIQLEEPELNLLRGMLNRVQYTLAKKDEYA